MSDEAIRIGSVCKCKRGIVGIVTQRPFEWAIENSMSRKIEHGSDGIYRGVTLGGDPWQSKCPTLLYRTVGEYLHANYIRKFETEHGVNL